MANVTRTGTAQVASTGQALGLSITLPDTTAINTAVVNGTITLGQVPSSTYNVAFIVDRSGSTTGSAGASVKIGDVNNDLLGNTILDAEIDSFRTLYNTIAASNVSSTSRATLIVFDDSGQQVFTGGFGAADANGNGKADNADFLSALTTIRAGGSTNFTAGLQQAQTFFAAEAGVGESNIVFFASDGDHNVGPSTDVTTTADAIRSTYSAQVRSFAIGTAPTLTLLDAIDGAPANSAVRVTDLSQLGSTLVQPTISSANIDRVEILLDNQVVQTIQGSQLTSTPLGLDFSTTLTTLNPASGNNNTVTVRAITAAASGATTVMASEDVNGTVTTLPSPVQRGVRYDFDGDGIADILWQRDDGTLAMSPSKTNKTFTTVAGGGGVGNNPGTDYRVIGVGHFDTDQKADILFRNADDSLVIYHMNGATVQSATTAFSGPGVGSRLVGIGDFNGNGIDDLLFENRALNQLTVYADGGTTADGIVFARPQANWSIQAVDDFNGDGVSEILWRNRDGRLATQTQNGTLKEILDGNGVNPGKTLTITARVMGTGDVNKDGRADIIFRNNDLSVSTILMSATNNVATGIQSGVVPSGTMSNWGITAIGNFDGGSGVTPDTDTEILWRNNPLRTSGNFDLRDYNGVSGSLLSNPGQDWAVANTVAVQRPPRAVQDTDMDGDGNSDILFRNSQTGQVAVWRMGGRFNVTSGGVTDLPNNDWSVIANGDFDGDGKADLMFRNKQTLQTAVWLMDGNRVRRGELVDNVSTDWSVVATGDFDGDGRSDVAWRNGTTGQFAIWRMNGTRVELSRTFDNAPPTWQFVGGADFDNDGRTDILLRDTSSGSIAIWRFGETTQLVSGSGTIGLPTDWNIEALADFDGDGRADILFRNNNSQEVALWQMNGDSIAGGLSLGPVAANWKVQSTGDINNDGSSDILWRNSNDGMLVAWDMQPRLNGGSVNSVIVANTLASEWGVVRPNGTYGALPAVA